MDYMAEVQEEFEKLREEGRRQVREQAARELERAQRESERAQRESERAQRESERAQREAREAVCDLCELLGIAVDDARRAHIASLDLDGIASLRVHLKAHRTWPM